MVWVFTVLLFLIVCALSFICWRLVIRLFEFDELLRSIIDPMNDYAEELRKVASAEGLLHDHPEVLAFHRANMQMLARIDAAIASIKEVQPKEPVPQGLPPQVE
jgi:hypothetical protein